MKRQLQSILRWVLVVGIAAGVVAGLTVVTSPHWDGPLGPIPGGAMAGEPFHGAAPDWPAIGQTPTVALQVDHHHPHSVSVGVLELDGRLYVSATLAPESKRWSTTLAMESTAVLRHEGVLYLVHATRVRDEERFGRLIAKAVAKYDPDYFVPATTWFFRLDWQPNAAN